MSIIFFAYLSADQIQSEKYQSKISLSTSTAHAVEI